MAVGVKLLLKQVRVLRWVTPSRPAMCALARLYGHQIMGLPFRLMIVSYRSRTPMGKWRNNPANFMAIAAWREHARGALAM